MTSQKSLTRGIQFKTAHFQLFLADSLTVFWGEWLKLRSRITQVAATGLVSPLIYILAFGLGLGSSIRPGSGITGNYDNYLEFILPGMVALSSMTISFGGTTFSICGERLFSKTFEEMLLTPVHPLALHIGKMLAGIVRGLMTSGSVILVAVLFTGNWNFLNPLFLLLLVLNCAVFAGLGVIIGLSVRSLESVGLYNNFVIVPMSFLGATFFDPSTLPVALKCVVYLLPLTYASTGLRAAVYSPLSEFPWYSIPILLVTAIALSFWGSYKFSHQQD
ncbi:ABC transporter permease [Nostoc sp. FACHB-110]|uniref:ABC transporter permease n=1 Tax=Nostoc sp. FACHB-110 TaxID=2692834 RepID=UPI0016850506|nr:ABC transporter permease [Nostoc sp. FACHB-110]MBD2436698.1 ABC transporter permease [Nostoc sp. FACHB-110]